MRKQKAYFFDMDGVLFNSMPNHAIAWVEVMKKHQLPFTAYDCYINEGRTGSAVIREAIWNAEQREAGEEELKEIYAEKAACFNRLTTESNQPTPTIENVDKVLQHVKDQGDQIWVVTGSGQRTLINNLQAVFPGIFQQDRMITAFDVTRGKPDPEPYLKAWERSGLKKEECFVIENAPLGIQSGKAAGLTVYAVNTGILTREDLGQADCVFDSMQELLEFLKA
jgi:HAD superfamily hydrolase (TIGR01509 family)